MHDFIAIGETTIDAFIRLEKGSATLETKGENQRIITLPFATKIPYESVAEIPAVGNASNAAVAAARLGLKTALVANVGDDENGEKCLRALREEGVSTHFIDIEKGIKTNYHYILWYEDDRTILQKHSKFRYDLPDIGEPKWIYLTSLGEDSLNLHLVLAEYLKNKPGINVAFQPGIFQIIFGREKLGKIYERTNIFFSNVEEAGAILGLPTLGIKELLKRVREIGPKIVVITDGPRGAYAYDGENMYFQPPYPDREPALERTGAGDAFASTTVAALALGLNLPSSLQWGAINSMSVVQEVGAQKGLLSREKIEEYLRTAPKDFQTKILP